MNLKIVMLYLLIATLEIFGQNNNWTDYTNTDYIWRMVIQDDSILWMATTGGLVRMNLIDSTYKIYTPADGEAYNNILCLSLDSDGNVWVGTSDQGAIEINNEQVLNHFTFENTNGGLLSNAIGALGKDRKGKIWFATQNGVCSYDGTNWKSYPQTGWARAMSFDSSGNIWIGRLKYDGTSWHDLSDTIKDYNVWDIQTDKNNNIWFGTIFNGIYQYNGEQWLNYTTANSGISSNHIYGISFDNSGNVWFATSNGINKFDGVNWQHYTIDNGLTSNWATCMAIDKNQNKWIGTHGSGLERFNAGIWKYYRIKNEIADNNVLKMAIDLNGNKWFATWSGVSEFDGKQWKTFTTDDGLPSNQVTDIAVAPNGNIWVSCYGGVAVFDGNKWTAYNTSNSGLPNNLVTCVAITTNDDKWFGTLYGGSAKLSSNGKWETYNNSNSGLKSVENVVFDITIDDQGNPWFATWGGASELKGEQWINYDTTNSELNSVFVVSIFNDHKGNLWFCSNGVVKFDGKNWTSIDTNNSGILSNSVSVVTQDRKGNYLFGTAKGLSILSDTTWKSFRTDDGLPGFNITDIKTDMNNKYWICTNSGQNPPFDILQALPDRGPTPGGVSVFSGNELNGEKSNGSGTPKDFILYQNYPNPFNSSTIISFKLLKNVHVELSVYDVIGRKLKTVINKYEKAGKYSIKFYGGNLSSGVYIFSIYAGGYIQSHKMVLLK